ncbi:hypothetical protein KCU92_g1765, partial [Aureobasidium melanogenum]|jgi:hypothetical protein
MIFRKQSAEIERLKQQIYAQDQHIRTQNTELKYLRSTNNLNITWKSACDQKDEIIKHQQQELERLGSTIDAAKQLHIENKKLYKDLHMQKLEIKCLLRNDASDFGWKIVADERNEVIKDQKQEIGNMRSRNDAAKELEISHQSLQTDYEHLQLSHRILQRKHKSMQQGHTSLQQDHNNLREEKTRFDKKIQDLEARLDTTTKEWLEAKLAQQHDSRLTMQKPFGDARPRLRCNSACDPKRTADDILAHLSNRRDLPSVVIAYLHKEFFLTGVSLGRVNDARFNEAVIDWACGTICVQQKVYNSEYIVHEDRSGACESCVNLGRICIQKNGDYDAVVVPLPEALRSGRRVEELGSWVRGH